MTAITAVLGTTELLETILLSLDTHTCSGLQTLLLSQRVNKTFKATIAGSPRLQEALFFRRTTRVDSQTIASTPQPDVNPLIRDFRALHRGRHDELEIRFYTFTQTSVCWLDKSPHDMAFDLRVMVYYAPSSPARALPPGSWQRMLFSQQTTPVPFCGRLFCDNSASRSAYHGAEYLHVGETLGEAVKRIWPAYFR
ncbi:hypothetical protein LTR56_007034 [Elasticomyces elasticus]|nr:hypothetical protein LTR56_007034 [Elasticomyces elasticus]KAK3664097.1 hypothetical protein LTR22_005061 [Elasticomyces elasticus]KAK4927666.1 hypothetical protein LTR49_005535 [Elasticomyces elasticus]KAK5767037.1 hypothetical protein LTS12_002802 [Elasticomyces elasticus]